MRALIERLRAARHIEVGLLIAALAVLGLMLVNGELPERQSGAGTEPERRLARLLEQIDGTGRVSAMIAQGEDGAVTGAVIVADGLDDVRTLISVQTAVRTLLGINLDRVCVIGKNGASVSPQSWLYQNGG